MTKFSDEIILEIIRHISKQKDGKGRVSELLNLGYVLDLVNSLMYAGLITIYKADCEDPNGRYYVTSLGRKYFKEVL